MLNDQGYISECTGDNVFTVHKDQLFTPTIASGALSGITRGVVLDIAAELGVPVKEVNMTRYDVWVADECFLTGSAAEVIPETSAAARTIGTGSPGPWTAKFMAAFKKRVLTEGTRI
jgi:branched-chain amino acid aminotransferase